MPLSRLLAAALALASLGVALAAGFAQTLDLKAIVLLAGGGVILLAFVGLAIWRNVRHFWPWVSVLSTFAALVLAALVLQVDQERPFSIRATLTGLFISGLALTFWAAFASTRTRRRDPMHRYYDEE